MELGKWADFGGRIEGSESVEDCAAREFVEETLGCVPVDIPPSRSKHTHISRVKKMLVHRVYFSRVSLIYRTDHRMRTYYIKEIAWDPTLPDRFQETLAGLKTNHVAYRNHPALLGPGDINPSWLEKTKIGWWSLARLGRVLQRRGKWETEHFRRSFLPILRIVSRKLQDCYK
jgi:hypothetical protein